MTKKADRHNAIRSIEKLRGSRVITYLTADRGVASTPMAEDVLRLTYDHLRMIGHVPQIDLFLYSRGGDAMLPWPLVNTIRHFCERFCVLIPFRAHSAATLIALGADDILMTPLGQLTPVEPTIQMPLNPRDPTNPNMPLGINVEDVASFMQFVKERAEVETEAGRLQALASLASAVNPVALGHLHRFHMLARQQARKLLELHMDRQAEDVEMTAIVEKLVKTLWAHEYKIGREEARVLGLKVAEPNVEQEEAVWSLFEGYEARMLLRKPIVPAAAFPAGQAHVALTGIQMAVVESTELTDVYYFDMDLSRAPSPTPPGQPQQFGPQVQMSVKRQEWKRA